jgi:DNA-binding transcriptional ArsR family regulator
MTNLASDADLDRLADTLRVLGNRTHLKAVALLFDHKLLNAGDLAEHLGISVGACSALTGKLLAYNLVFKVPAGNRNIYKLADGAIVSAVLKLAGRT